MHWAVILGASALASVATGLELLDAKATTCKSAADCPVVTCYAVSTCDVGFCKYQQLDTGAKCPGKSCSNGGACDDDANDFCDALAVCQNGFKPATTKCPGKSCSNGGACDDDNNDHCDGSGVCVSAYKSSASICRPSAGQCDVAETCTGVSGTCPLDMFATREATCSGKSNGGGCDGIDKCDGHGNCVDVYLPSTTVCRASKGQCDVAESCTGSSGQCPTDAFKPTTEKCTGTCNGNPCDGQDLCDGKGNCVDVFLKAGTVCGTTGNDCVIPAQCTGNMGFCPPDTFADTTTKCVGASKGGLCDTDDKCDGNGACVDKFLDSKTVCKEAVGYARATYCTGKDGACPATSFLDATHLRETTEEQAQDLAGIASSTSPVVLVGLVAAVAVVVALFTARARAASAEDDSYLELATM